MTTLVVLDTATMRVARYVGGGASPYLSHVGYLKAGDGLADALERFRASPPAALNRRLPVPAPVDAA